MTPAFDVILADCPWPYETWSPKGNGRSPKYPTMTLKDMAALPIADIAAPNCVLFFWVVDWLPPSVCDGVATAWGFTYRTRAWVWIKANPNGDGFFKGKGFYTRANPEDCWLYVRGNMPVPTAQRPDRIIYSPVGEHSAKPSEQYDRIETMYPHRRYLELFARQRRPSWAAFGNEVPGGSDILFPSAPLPLGGVGGG
jgi:N6-adenosine-specific RNA methylase IME4